MPVSPHVTILMATMNGERYLPEQLDSLKNQSHKNWQLIISDDGSTDNSLNIVNEFMADNQNTTLLQGPRKGGAANFLHLVQNMRNHAPEESWLAFSDQDDVWLPQRLARGIKALSDLPKEQFERPALYCARTWISNSTLQKRRLSPRRPRPLGFRNALVQNIAAGNTILLNPAGARLIQAAANEAEQVVVHDWWVYQIITGCGGHAIHDDTPCLLYRQHTINQIGANDGFLARLHRLRQVLEGEFQRWNSINIAALSRSQERLTSENKALLLEFTNLRSAPLPKRLALLVTLKLYRQSLASTLALWLAVILGKV